MYGERSGVFGSSLLFIIVAFAGLALAGLLLYRGSLFGLGRLPGDLRYSGRRTKVYAPFTSMLLLSVFLSLLLTLLGWLFG